MTFKQLQDEVLDYCQELQSITDFSITKVKRFINRAQLDFIRQTKCKQLDIDITTVANQVSYTSSDAANLAFAFDVFEVRYDDGTEWGNKLTFRDHVTLPEQYQYGRPYEYWITGNHSKGNFTIGTFPIISVSSNTLRVSAFVYPLVDLSANTDEPVIEDAWQDALPEYAAYRLFKIYSHRDKAFVYRSREHKAEYQNYVEDYNYRAIKQSDEITSIIDVYGD